MGPLILGAFAFLLFYLHDYRQLKEPDKAFSYLFYIGIGCLCISTGVIVTEACLSISNHWAKVAAWLFLSLFFCILLFYTLFLALPYSATYRSPSGGRPLVAHGVYALCRHPGILWFTAIYVCLWQAVGGRMLFYAAVLFSGLNLFYAAIQDRWVFPRQFDEYDRYRKEIPFLIPNLRSIRRCMETLPRSRYHVKDQGGRHDL